MKESCTLSEPFLKEKWTYYEQEDIDLLARDRYNREKREGEEHMFGIEALYPDKIIESVYTFDWEKAAKKYRGVIFDVDTEQRQNSVP